MGYEFETGRVQKSKIIKMQLKRFSYQTLCVFSQIKHIKIGLSFLSPKLCPRAGIKLKMMSEGKFQHKGQTGDLGVESKGQISLNFN